MKKRLVLLLAMALGAIASAATATASVSSADTDYAEFKQIVAAVRAAPAGMRGEALNAWHVSHFDQASRAGERFATVHVDDPRRWEAWLAAIVWRRQFPSPTADADRAAWEARRMEVSDQLLTTAGVPETVWLDAVVNRINTELSGRRAAPGNLAKVDHLLDELARRAPASPSRVLLEGELFRTQGRTNNLAAMRPRLERLARETAQPKLVELAAGWLRVLDAENAPLELKFTAADGREVDLAKLRGKVVLVDFWATWCVPCVAELPNIVANYQKYHDKGFEVVGIALENGRLAPNDTPEQAEAKLTKAKQALNDFTAKNGMPWPQHFDGKWWKNAISTRFAIESIPTMFLLDQDGKVVSTNARGEKLEAEVKRLLKF